jgi:hypothetical protein
VTQVILYGSIFNKIRPRKEWGLGFGKLFHCAMCMGFWVGIFLAFLSPSCSLWQYELTIANIFLLGCLSSGTSYILNRVINDDGISVSLNKNQ